VPIAATDSVESAAAFDCIAAQYDAIFTHSAIGVAQRQLVHYALSRHFTQGSRILDMNCGTGEDAIYLGAQSIEVVACDASLGMIEVCRRKLAAAGSALPITFLVCANERLDQLSPLAPFDGALSNFGGLNCTTDLAVLRNLLACLLVPGSALFVCLMGRVCAWEIVWFLLTGHWNKAFRRLRANGAQASVGGQNIRVYYPSVRRAAEAFAPSFRLKASRGIGVALPPSWLERHFRNRPGVIRMLQWIDHRFGSWPLVRGCADHVLLQFVREEQ
jgi:ubiquinone/menaquinone biosynthesis C-methylase UbiE